MKLTELLAAYRAAVHATIDDFETNRAYWKQAPQDRTERMKQTLYRSGDRLNHAANELFTTCGIDVHGWLTPQRCDLQQRILESVNRTAHVNWSDLANC